MTHHRTLKVLGLLSAVCLAAFLAMGVVADSKRIDIEPETGLLKAPMKVYKSDAASGGKCVGTADKIVPQGQECGGTVKVTFTVATSGNYIFWGRAKWLDDCGDSFYVQIDEGQKRVFGEHGTEGQWKWFKLTGAKFNMSAGTHTLYIHGREDGALLDKVILLHESNGYVPQGKSG